MNESLFQKEMICPQCKSLLILDKSERELGELTCPECNKHILYSENPSPIIIAKIKKKSEFIGTGCLVQTLGIIACFFFFPIGVIIGLILLILGGRMAIKYVCSECKNKVEKGVRLCPACKAQFR